MSIFVISDLHLSFACEKPMAVFGPVWENYEERLEQQWRSLVGAEDVVVMPGDLSWAMTEQEVLPDLLFVNELPGKKILLKGNHEYWWSTVSKLAQLKEREGLDSLTFLHNDAILLPEYSVAVSGTRGWKCPVEEEYTDEDEKLYRREGLRLEASLKKGRMLLDQHGGGELLAFLHYPPFNRKREGSIYTALLGKYGVRRCFYGHLHGTAQRYAINGRLSWENMLSSEAPLPSAPAPVEYRLVSADFLHFQPIRIL